MQRAALIALFLPSLALAGPVATPYESGGIYELGETVGWHVTLPAGEQPTEYRYEIRKNNLTVIGSGTLDLSRAAHIETRVDEPAMLYVAIEDDDPATKDLALGAAVAPERLQPSVPAPADFDEFWAKKIGLLQQTPSDPVLMPKSSGRPGVEYALLRMNHIEGRTIHGQVARPATAGGYLAWCCSSGPAVPIRCNRSGSPGAPPKAGS